jgi:hypothetical protein
MGHAVDASLDTSPAGLAVLPGKMLQIAHCTAKWMNPKAAKTVRDLIEAPFNTQWFSAPLRIETASCSGSEPYRYAAA